MVQEAYCAVVATGTVVVGIQSLGTIAPLTTAPKSTAITSPEVASLIPTVGAAPASVIENSVQSVVRVMFVAETKLSSVMLTVPVPVIRLAQK